MTQWSLEGLRSQKTAIFAIASRRGARTCESSVALPGVRPNHARPWTSWWSWNLAAASSTLGGLAGRPPRPSRLQGGHREASRVLRPEVRPEGSKRKPGLYETRYPPARTDPGSHRVDRAVLERRANPSTPTNWCARGFSQRIEIIGEAVARLCQKFSPKTLPHPHAARWIPGRGRPHRASADSNPPAETTGSAPGTYPTIAWTRPITDADSSFFAVFNPGPFGFVRLTGTASGLYGQDPVLGVADPFSAAPVAHAVRPSHRFRGKGPGRLPHKCIPLDGLWE